MREKNCDHCANIAEFERKQAEAMEKHGWFSHTVCDDPDSPTNFNYHTHGFRESFGVPDVQVVLPIEPHTIHQVVHSLVRDLRAGRVFKTRCQEARVLRDFDVMFVEAVESGREVWRMILPDPNNCLTAEEMSSDYAVQWRNLRP